MLFGSRAFSLALMLQLCGGEVGDRRALEQRAQIRTVEPLLRVMKITCPQTCPRDDLCAHLWGILSVYGTVH